MERYVATGVERPAGPLAERPVECAHREVVGEQKPVEADPSAHDVRDHHRRERRRQRGVPVAVEHMGGHAHRQVGQGGEGRDGRLVGIRLRQGLVAVAAGPAVPRQVLQHRQHAGVPQALGIGAGMGGHDSGVAGEGAFADHLMGHAGGMDVRDRGAVHVDAEPGQHVADGVRRLPRLPDRSPGEACGGGEGRPVRRGEPRHAPAFLVDQHGRIAVAHSIAQFGGQPADPGRVRQVAVEENEAERVRVAEEVPLRGRERRAGAAEDGRKRRSARPGPLSGR